MDSSEFDSLLREVAPLTPQGADVLLDLREVLLEGGHPGRCVGCFFSLLGDLGHPGSLGPLRNWLENNVEVGVRAGAEVLEVLPLNLAEARSLDGFCQAKIDQIRYDRAYGHSRIDLSFRYRPQVEGV